MVYGVWGTQLARISVVDLLDELVLDEIVRPEENNPIVDCNTRFSGLTKEQIDTAKYDLQGVQKKLFELVNSETILIGHSLESDLKALRIVHLKVVDTSVKIIQEEEGGHDSKEDASACMKLMYHKREFSQLQYFAYCLYGLSSEVFGHHYEKPLHLSHFTNIVAELLVGQQEQQSHVLLRTEGVRSLYKGLIPNLIGVTPSKAVYFLTYSQSKYLWNNSGILVPNSAAVHMTSAGLGGKFLTATIINPVWLVKTRLQLHQGHLGLLPCIKRIYANEGIKGFYKGVTASYVGISETIIQFVVYEYLRARLDEADAAMDEDTKFYKFMVIGGMAKFCACITTYPHEVVRTRLREEGSEARGFWKTLRQVWREGRFSSCYRGVSVQLMRSVPNTAITMGTYELVVSLLHSYLRKPEEESSR
uniref:Exonuclease domain-containing protein n=1 Tax=Ditylenchus dipsaci TaxID=166011 RepID=A0A915DKG6_9BILA